MGSRTENLLLDDLEELGLAGVRVDFGTGHGFHSAHDAGDIIAGRPVKASGRSYDAAELYIIEEKYVSHDHHKYIQEDGEKLGSMIEFAERIGATPTLAVRWSSKLDWSPGATHFIADARDVARTDAGNISVKPETAEAEFKVPEEYFR